MFKDDLRQKRVENGLTMKELGDILGRAPSTLCGWESGKFLPSDRDMKKCAELFDLDFSKYDEERRNRQRLPAYMTAPRGGIVNSFDGQKLKDLMRVRQLSADKLAKHAGVSKQTIKNWVTGSVKPCGDRLEKVSRYFGVNENFWSKEEERGEFTPKVFVDREVAEKEKNWKNPYTTQKTPEKRSEKKNDDKQVEPLVKIMQAKIDRLQKELEELRQISDRVSKLETTLLYVSGFIDGQKNGR